jgi:hypothetical protein
MGLVGVRSCKKGWQCLCLKEVSKLDNNLLFQWWQMQEMQDGKG